MLDGVALMVFLWCKSIHSARCCPGVKVSIQQQFQLVLRPFQQYFFHIQYENPTKSIKPQYTRSMKATLTWRGFHRFGMNSIVILITFLGFRV
jgi:hypothetical protein